MTYNSIDIADPIRVCFLGCGNITARHAKVMPKVGHHIEMGFASRSIAKAEEYKNKYQGIKAYGSYQDAVVDEWADVIMICTPPKYHLDWAQNAIKNNKHVILEKPPLLKSTDFDLLSVEANPRSLQIMVAENYYYKPLRKKLIDVIKSGLIGDPLFINISAAKHQAIDDWRGDADEVGFGALYEGGIHWISFMNNLGYKVVDAKGIVPGKKTNLEKSVQVHLQTDRGPAINLTYSWEVDALFKGLRVSRVFGTKGSIRWESNGIFMIVRGEKWRFKIPGLAQIGGFQPMFDDFFNALRTGTAPDYNITKAKADLKTIEDIYASIH